MQINVRNMEYEATPANTVIFTGQTLLNGIYTDLGEDYVFLPEFAVDDYPEVATQLQTEHIAVYDMESYDPNSAPFCFMINGLCRVFRSYLDDFNIDDLK